MANFNLDPKKVAKFQKGSVFNEAGKSEKPMGAMDKLNAVASAMLKPSMPAEETPAGEAAPDAPVEASEPAEEEKMHVDPKHLEAINAFIMQMKAKK